MKFSHTLLAILFIVSAAIRAQVVPATTGPAGPAGLPVSGTLRYDLRYSQIAQFYGGSQGDAQSSALSGDVTYANSSQARPFSLTYSGGDMWNISGGTGGSGYFQHLLASQGIVGRKWSVRLSDDVSSTPQAPTTGFSGIPGVGNLPSEPGPPSQPILTQNTRSIYNTVNSSFTHSLDYATSLGVSGSYGILRFPDGNGLETDQLQVAPQITRRLNAFNSIFAQYSFARFSYPGYPIIMGTQSAMFGYQRTWSRRLTTSVSAGPEWSKMSGTVITVSIPPSTVLQIPLPPTTSIGLGVNASVSYATRSTSITLGYFQASNAGGGVLESFGTHNRDLSAGLTRQFGRSLSISATGAYMRTQALISGVGLQAGLVEPGSAINGMYGGVAATRRLGRYITVNANYTAVQQSSSSALPANAISGLSQVIGFGIGYSPREKRFKK